jgi:purine-binding chemotaxis protein CheW
MKQFIEFTLGTENYVIEMSYIREIIKLPHITELVGTPGFIKSEAKVCDEVITIIDLRQIFNINFYNHKVYEPIIIILEYDSENIGLLVDDVVSILSSNNIENMPNLIHLGIIREIMNSEEKILPILNIESFFAAM